MREIASPPIGIARWTGAEVAGPRAEPLWESALVIVATIMFATNITETVLGFGPDPGNPPQVRLAYLAVYAAFGMMLFVSNGLIKLPVRVPLLTLVLAMAPLSILWSVDPGETLERSTALVGSSLFGAYLGWRFTLGRIIFLSAVAMAITSCLSLAAILLVPSVGIAHSVQWGGTWIGLNPHKSGLGVASTITCIVLGYAMADNRGRWRVAFCLAFLVALVLLVGSRSTGSLLSAVIAGALALWARHLQKLPKQVPVLTFIAVFAVVITGVQIIGQDVVEHALAMLGKRTDLSSRIPLWSIVWSFIEDRFWLGYGYEAFWQPDSPGTRFIRARLFFTPYYSHNGLLETWLNGGLVMVVMTSLLLVTVTARSAILFARWRTLAISSFPVVFCGYFVLGNLVEAPILLRNNLSWALFVAIAVFTAKWVRLRLR